MKTAATLGFAYLCTVKIIILIMKKNSNNSDLFDYYKEDPPSLRESILITIKVDFHQEAFFTSHTHSCLFEACDDAHRFTHWPQFEVEHDDTWEGFGRAYYESRDYAFAAFHCSLCSVDELNLQVEAWQRQYEQNRIATVPSVAVEPSVPDFLGRYFAQHRCNEALCAFVEDFQAVNTFSRKHWEADDKHSCRPFEKPLHFLHQLVKLSLGVQRAQATAASRPCCRSFLVTACHQKSGDDLLGH